jgi:hypothetical protein
MKLKQIVESNDFLKSKKVLRESVLNDMSYKDDIRLLEQRVSEHMKNIPKSEIEEGVFDTLKNFGKNAVNSVVDAWKKAKRQGDEDEMKRLEKKLAGLKSKLGIPPEEKLLNPNPKKPTKKSNEEIAEETTIQLLSVLKKTSPDSYNRIINLVKQGAKGVERIDDNPKIQQAEKQIVPKIAGAGGDGLVSKIDNITKSGNLNPTTIVASMMAVKDATKISPEKLSDIVAAVEPKISSGGEDPTNTPKSPESSPEAELPDKVKKFISLLTDEEKQTLLKILEKQA